MQRKNNTLPPSHRPHALRQIFQSKNARRSARNRKGCPKNTAQYIVYIPRVVRQSEGCDRPRIQGYCKRLSSSNRKGCPVLFGTTHLTLGYRPFVVFVGAGLAPARKTTVCSVTTFSCHPHTFFLIGVIRYRVFRPHVRRITPLLYRDVHRSVGYFVHTPDPIHGIFIILFDYATCGFRIIQNPVVV